MDGQTDRVAGGAARRSRTALGRTAFSRRPPISRMPGILRGAPELDVLVEGVDEILFEPP
jgi:hypothetical protein